MAVENQPKAEDSEIGLQTPTPRSQAATRLAATVVIPSLEKPKAIVNADSSSHAKSAPQVASMSMREQQVHETGPEKRQDRPCVDEHRRLSPGPRHRSPSSDSRSSRTLRALQQRLSNIWAHVVGLERVMNDGDLKESRIRREGELREPEIGQPRDEDARRRQRMREDRVAEERSETGRRTLQPMPRRVKEVIIVDEQKGNRVDSRRTSR